MLDQAGSTLPLARLWSTFGPAFAGGTFDLGSDLNASKLVDVHFLVFVRTIRRLLLNSLGSVQFGAPNIDTNDRTRARLRLWFR